MYNEYLVAIVRFLCSPNQGKELRVLNNSIPLFSWVVVLC